MHALAYWKHTHLAPFAHYIQETKYVSQRRNNQEEAGIPIVQSVQTAQYVALTCQSQILPAVYLDGAVPQNHRISVARHPPQ